MEFIYTNTTDDFTSTDVLAEVGRNLPGVPRVQAINILYNARQYLERNGIISSRKIKFRSGNGGSAQMAYTIINRDRIIAVLDLIKTQKQEQLPVAVTETKIEEYIPPISVAIDMDKDDIIIALCKENRDLKKEVSELIEERSSRLAAIHDASLKVEEATRKLANTRRLPSGVAEYLKDVGILPEKKDEKEKK
jgi:hypothetical protein